MSRAMKFVAYIMFWGGLLAGSLSGIWLMWGIFTFALDALLGLHIPDISFYLEAYRGPLVVFAVAFVVGMIGMAIIQTIAQAAQES